MVCEVINTTVPSFYVSRGNQNKMTVNFDPYQRYLTIAQNIYEWEGLPDDVPVGHIEQALFWYGCVGAKDVPGIGVCIFGATPSTWTIYGEPASWLPTGLRTVTTPVLMDKSDNPALYTGISVADKIAAFADVQKQSIISLRQNVIGMRQPIALDGNPGNSADAFVLMNELESGEQYIPVIEASKLGIKVIDLNVNDHTQSLINTYDAMDREILSYMGIKNSGTEKLSGITPEETMSITQELSLVSTYGLKLREIWCDKINAVLGTNFSVKISGAYVESDIDNDSIPDPLDDREDKVEEEL